MPLWLARRYVVDRFVDGVVDKIAEIVKTPDHPLRAAFDTYVRRFVASFSSRPIPRSRADVDDMRAEILRSRAGRRRRRSGLARCQGAHRGVVGRRTPRKSRSDAWMARLVARVAREILADRALLDRLNANVLVPPYSRVALEHGVAAACQRVALNYVRCLLSSENNGDRFERAAAPRDPADRFRRARSRDEESRTHTNECLRCAPLFDGPPTRALERSAHRALLFTVKLHEFD